MLVRIPPGASQTLHGYRHKEAASIQTPICCSPYYGYPRKEAIKSLNEMHKAQNPHLSSDLAVIAVTPSLESGGGPPKTVGLGLRVRLLRGARVIYDDITNSGVFYLARTWGLLPT